MVNKLKKVLIFEIIILLLIFLILFLYNRDIFNIIMEKFDQDEFIINMDKNSISEDILSSSNDDIYEAIERGLLEVKDKINLKGYTGSDSADNVFEIVEEVVKNNPEIMYYEGGKYSNCILIPSYIKPKEEIIAHQDIVRKIKLEITDKIIKPEMSDYEKEKAIHDFIINNTIYDVRYFDKDKQTPPEFHTVYGVLVEGVAVCEGYAKTMKYLLDEAGVESIIISGIAKDENHAWNLVKLDNDYYHIDSTWDDPVMEDGSNIIKYDYFNVNDEEIGVTHKWDREKYPLSKGIEYNYYYYNDLVVKDKEEFYEKLKYAILNKVNTFEVKVLGYKESDYDISEFVKSIVQNNNLKVKSISFSYSTNPNLGIIRISFNYE